MGVSDPNLSRLKVILILFLTLFAIYSCELIFFSGSTNQDYLSKVEYDALDPDIKEVARILGQEEALQTPNTDFATIIAMTLTFTFPAIEPWMTVMFAPLTAILLVIGIYLLADYIYDWIKALPLT